MELSVLGRRARAAAALALLGTAFPAAAQGQITGLRFGTHPAYDRIVLELGPLPVEAYRVDDSDELRIELQAAPPQLAAAQQQRLAQLGAALQATPGGGTRLSVARRGPGVAAFRLGGPGVQRVVLDLAKGAEPLAIPADAQPLPLGGAAVQPQRPLLDGVPPREDPSAQLQSAAATGAPAPQRGAPEVGAAPVQPGPTEKVWVSVRSIEFVGLAGGPPTAQELLELELSVARTPSGDLQAAAEGAPGERRKLRELMRGESGAPRLGGSVLQQMVERIADRFADAGQYGTRIDIRKRELELLLAGQTQALRIHIQAPAAAMR